MKLLFVFGTRPEAIKMAPIIKAAKEDAKFSVKVLVTGQHRFMLDQVLKLFNIVPDYDLNLMRECNSLNDIVRGVINGVDRLLIDDAFDYVLVHGDTTTAMAAAMAAFHRRIKVIHVEAGLRTYNINSPWPEEMNRQFISRIATLHFAPTELSRQNLIQEGINEETVLITGNTVIDTLHNAIKIIEEQASVSADLNNKFKILDPEKILILVTGHRRENFGKNFANICEALKQISVLDERIQIVYPVHLNPQIKEPVFKILGHINNIHLIEPQEYLPFVYLMQKAFLILTDSGGIQEEAPSLGKPVLVMRDNTERQEAVSAGTVKLIGTKTENIVNEVRDLIFNKEKYSKMVEAKNPYGDGRASRRILSSLLEF